MRDTLTLLDQAIVFAKGRVDTASVVEMLGTLDPEVIDTVFQTVLSQDRQQVMLLVKTLEQYDAEVVLDEFLEFVKTQLFEPRTPYTPLLLERFFRILADAKGLLAIGADNGFVLGLTLLKMIEAQHIDTIDEQIATLQQNRETPPVPHTPAPTPPARTAPEPSRPVATAPQDGPTLFRQLIAKIYDRSERLGNCFESSVRFVALEPERLIWESCAEDACKAYLVEYLKVIKELVAEIFGPVSIKSLPCQESPPTGETPGSNEETPSLKDEAPQPSAAQPEGGGESCVQNATIGPAPEGTDINPDDILQTPFVQKAIELFEPKSIKIMQKI